MKAINYGEFLKIPPYSLDKKQKGDILTSYLTELSKYHYDNCFEYRRITDGLHINLNKIKCFSQLPFLPVSLFKDKELISVERKEIFKTMMSSGTTGQKQSKIFLDRETAANQQKTLVKIVSSFTGALRMPMIIIDSPDVIKNRESFSARGAGILGFSIFGTEKIYAFDESMNLNIEQLMKFLEKHKGQKILLFGFTYMIWQYFYKELLNSDEHIDLSDGILIHGGGWKKLENEAVSTQKFRESLYNITHLKEVYNYYGMVEQTGCIYMECSQGHLHASIFSDIIIRRSKDFTVAEHGEAGIIQVFSALPGSYPGHSLITEDVGIILGEDDCPCGRKGKYFEIKGRIKNAEVRGCSDTYERR